MKGKPWYGTLGDLIAKGESSAGEIITQVASEGAPLPEVMSMVQQLFDRGVFEDELDGDCDTES